MANDDQTGERAGQDGVAASLTPFSAPLRVAAEAALAEIIRAWLGAPGASVRAERQVSIGTEGPTRIVVREGDARLGLVLRRGATDGWRAGPITFTVEPAVEGRSPTSHASSRRWLRDLSSWFSSTAEPAAAQQGAAIAEAHHRWATLLATDDRHYRHVEQSIQGPAAFLRPVFRCSQDCHFCWQGRDWPDPPEDLVFRWLDELAATGVTRMTICGGEPTLFRRLPELVARAARDHAMRVHLDTNAIRLRDPSFARSLREAGLDSVLVSFHSADGQISDAMTRAPGTWSRTVAGIHGALDAGLVVALNCVVERTNVEGLEEHARFVREQFVDAHPGNPVRIVNYSQPGKYYDSKLFLEKMVPLDEVRPHLTRAARLLHETGVLLEITGSCGFPGCVVSELPHVVAWRPNATHDATNAAGRSHDPGPCLQCVARSRCVGVRREYVDRFGDRGLIPYASEPRSSVPTIAIDGAWPSPVAIPDARSAGSATAARVRLPVLPSDDRDPFDVT